MEQFSILKSVAEFFGLPACFIEHQHVVMAIVVLLIITIISFIAWRDLRHTKKHIVPKSIGSFANIFEVLTESLLRLMQDMLGDDARRHLPLIGALFVYILVSNIIGVIPGLAPPTDNINTNLACALVVFFYYNVVGIRKHGIKKYISHMAGPVAWLIPLFLPIELISHLFRPVSLSVRLFGNMTGDHIVLGVFSRLIPVFVPIIFMGLAIFVAFIQALVFTLLSVIYISLATKIEDH